MLLTAADSDAVIAWQHHADAVLVVQADNLLRRYQIPPTEIKASEQYRNTLTWQASCYYGGAGVLGLLVVLV